MRHRYLLGPTAFAPHPFAPQQGVDDEKEDAIVGEETGAQDQGFASFQDRRHGGLVSINQVQERLGEVLSQFARLNREFVEFDFG